MGVVELHQGDYEIRTGTHASEGTGIELVDVASGQSYTFTGDNATIPTLIVGTDPEVTSLVGNNLSVDANGNLTAVDTAPNAYPDTASASGDGTTKVFSLSHSLGTTPSAVSVQPTSPDGNADFHISGKTSSAVEITYSSAPGTGTDNLTYDLILVE